MSILKNKYKNLIKGWGKIPVALTLIVGFLIVSVLVVVAASYYVDDPNDAYEVNGAWFMSFKPDDATGTGLFEPYLTIGGSGVTQGYNSDSAGQFDEVTGGERTHSILLSEVPYLMYEGKLYREFQLDANQTGSNTLISIDEVQIWLGENAANITGFVPGATEIEMGTFPGFSLTPVYNLDADEDNYVGLNADAAGSGKRDLKLLVPDAFFGPYDEECVYMGTGCDQYVVFYTMFGEVYVDNDGFEEWGVAIYNVARGFKWEDLNANGIWDVGEPPLEDWLICAQEVDGGMDVGDPICMMTGADGSYTLPLPDGDYRIYETCPPGEVWYQSYPAPTGGVCGSGVHYPVSVSGGDTVEGRNFGNYEPTPEITITKTGDTLSKIGDTVDYIITVENTSMEGARELDCHITDPIVGVDEHEVLAWDDLPYVINVYSFVIPVGASDPFVNTAYVECTYVGGTAVVASDDDDHSVNLFQPAITFDKTGDMLSKIGDTVDYTLTLTNTSSADSPNLECTITDTILGINKNVTLASGASDVTNKSFVIPVGAADPFINTAYASCSPIGFPNILTAQDAHSVDLFQPAITLTKTGDLLSKIGDTVNYVITLNNTSSMDTPNLECTITDTILGINKSVTLASGASDVTNKSFVIPVGAADPFVNTAYASCSPIGFPNILPAQDSHSINLFQPSITFTKTALESYSKAGDTVNYTITLTNTSSMDTPNLVCTITDKMLGISQPVTLAAGAAPYVLSPTHVVLASDLDPLVNTASVSCSPTGFPNILTASAGASVDLVHPAFTLTKTCMVEPVIAGEYATFQVVFTNTGDVPLVVTFDETLTGAGCPATGVPVTVANGTNLTCTVQKMADTEPGPSVVSNTINAHVTLPAMYGLDNYWDPTASDSCDIYGVKSGYKWNDMNHDGVWDLAEPVLSLWKIHFFAWDPVGMAWEASYDEVQTNALGKYEFDMVIPGVKYAVCEVLEAGFMQTYPDATLPAEGYVDCTQFGAGYGPIGYMITLMSGEYEVDNNFGNYKPTGCTYTFGYWKTHSMYGPAGPYDPTWDLKAGGDAIFLNPGWNTGFTWYSILQEPPKGGNAYIILAYQYVAAWLNINNVDPLLASDPSVLGTAMADAEALLGSYLPTDILTPAERAEFIMLADLLNQYNEGYLGVPHCE